MKKYCPFCKSILVRQTKSGIFGEKFCNKCLQYYAWSNYEEMRIDNFRIVFNSDDKYINIYYHKENVYDESVLVFEMPWSKMKYDIDFWRDKCNTLLVFK